ncbi:SIS domain-containing protein [Ferrovibrio sp.]|uniref:D-sedoheptulose-7-phosphate isomerase n=1 Tax=Ferrovibrio sp. TaxID=1917215 RepID=UPI00262C5477|nr:SIS domain-containing protein [Ferrovibrio sp.]
MSLLTYLEDSAALIRHAATPEMAGQVDRAIDCIAAALSADLPLLVCGNGGSASDAMHIAGELVGRFLKERRALNCIALSADQAIITAWSNDYSYETVFSRQVEAYGRAGGVLLGLSTSGNSANVIKAAEAAKAKGMTVIGLTGKGGGKLKDRCDILIEAPSNSTPHIQQVHICLYHYICDKVEAKIAG